jgi:hypothetical protein
MTTSSPALRQPADDALVSHVAQHSLRHAANTQHGVVVVSYGSMKLWSPTYQPS